MCDFCEWRQGEFSKGDGCTVRLDLNGRELDVSYFCGDKYWNGCSKFKIEYCPFCGRKLED